MPASCKHSATKSKLVSLIWGNDCTSKNVSNLCQSVFLLAWVFSLLPSPTLCLSGNQMQKVLNIFTSARQAANRPSRSYSHRAIRRRIGQHFAHSYWCAGSVTIKCNGVTRCRFYLDVKAITFKSDNGSNVTRAITICSDNGFFLPRAINFRNNNDYPQH